MTRSELRTSHCSEGLVRASAGLPDDAVGALSGLALRMRAVELLTVERLLPVATRFPATIQEHLTLPPSPSVGIQDAFVDPSEPIGLVDLLELLSADGLAPISPRLYRGWQDRVQARRDARSISTEAVGFSLTAEERDALLMAVAIRNRLMRSFPPLDVELGQIEEAIAAVERLHERLVT